MYEESLAAYDYAINLPNVDKGCIVIIGFSLGTGSAVYLAAHRPVARLILAAPYANGADAYNNMLPIFYGPMKALVKQKLPSDQYAPDVTCPTMIIASQSDEVIPFSSSERLFQLFSGEIDFIKLKNENHNSLFSGAGVYDGIRSFLEKIASK